MSAFEDVFEQSIFAATSSFASMPAPLLPADNMHVTLLCAVLHNHISSVEVLHEYGLHSEENAEEGTVSWDAAGSTVRNFLLVHIRELYDDITRPSSPIWNTRPATVYRLHELFGGRPWHTILELLLHEMAHPPGHMVCDSLVHLRDIVDVQLIYIRELVEAKLLTQFPHLSPFTPTAVYMHKAEAIDRLAEMFHSPPSVVMRSIEAYEAKDSIQWPVVFTSLMHALSGSLRATHVGSKHEKSLKACVDTRNWVLQDLRNISYSSEGVMISAPDELLNSETIVAMCSLLRWVLSHRVNSSIPPIRLERIEAMCAAFPLVLTSFCSRLRDSEVNLSDVTTATLLESSHFADGPDMATFIVEAVRLCITVQRQSVFLNVYHFVKHMHTVPRSWRCEGEKAPPHLIARPDPYSLKLAAPRIEMEMCGCKACQSLALGIGYPEQLALAFLSPSPWSLYERLCREPYFRLHYDLVYKMLWTAAFSARREQFISTGAAAAACKRRRAAITCEICFVEEPCVVVEGGCPLHPQCLNCFLTGKEHMIIDMFLKGVICTSALERCPFPDCSHVHSYPAWKAYLAKETTAMVHFLLSKTPGLTCAACSLSILPAFDNTVATCQHCSSQTCMQCLALAHVGEVCPVSFLRSLGTTPDVVLSEARMQKCPGCGAHCVKATGCNHMRCTCGTHWCWLCNAAISSTNPSAHFTDVIGGSPDMPCTQFKYSLKSETARMEGVIRGRTDIPHELKEVCVAMLRGVDTAASVFTPLSEHDL